MDRPINNSASITPDMISADSHVGLIRELNEDSFIYCARPDKPTLIALVADGIGGHESGDIASCLCCRIIINSWRREKMENCESAEEIESFLKDTIKQANTTIYGLNQTYNMQHPMGTTLACAVFTPDKVISAHAGDSRCYRCRDEKTEAITEDHSYVAELVRKNVIRPDEAAFHPFAHIISKSVGPIPILEPEIKTFDKNPGDRYMLCTDGLTNHIDDNRINEIISKSATPVKAAKTFMAEALQAGGEDNITILCVFS